MAERPADLQGLKREFRARARACRRQQEDTDQLSRQICAKLAALPEYARAATVMFYVDARCEVRTRQFLPTARGEGKRVVVPYCVGDRLELFRLESIDELAAGAWRIPEPKLELRSRADRKVDLSELDLIVVPGVAFDAQGGRIGQGKGYYDRLLHLVRPDATLVALAFECQLFPTVPMGPHDVYMDKVITERAVYSRG